MTARSNDTADRATEPRHPIAVVADRTGLSQDVLRAWERRYDAVRPVRGPGGQRHYTDADVRRLALLHAATRAGRSIGHVATLPTDTLQRLVDDDDAAARSTPEARAAPVPGDGRTADAPPSAAEALRDAALAHARALDGPALDETLRRSVAALGVAPFIETVAAPLLRLVGDEWHAGRLSPASEHLVSSVLHDVLAGTMRALPRAPGAPRALVATPAGDRHAIGAALVGAAAAVEGWQVLYLGADLPAADIADAARAAGVHVAALSIVYVDAPARVLDEVRTLRERLPSSVALIAGGGGAGALAAELTALGARVQSSIPGLVAELRRARRGVA